MNKVLIIFLLLAAVVASAQPASNVMLFGSFGINTTEESGSPTPGNYNPISFDVSAKRFAVTGKALMMSKKEKHVGIKLQTGFYTLGIDEEYYDSRFDGDNDTFTGEVTYNYILTAGPVFYFQTKFIDISLEPTLGIISGISPDLTVQWEYPDIIKTYSWTRTNDKPKLSYMLGISLYREINKKLILSFSADYMMANSYRTTVFVDETYYKDTGESITSTFDSDKPVETNKTGMVFTAGLGFYIMKKSD